ncbi:MAG: hypothetical protein ITG02_10495 [Patulibacter sp.]|nr:hypothetical protein [Patulibacter sp.]
MLDTHALDLAIRRITLTVGEAGHRDAERAFAEVFGLASDPVVDGRWRCLRALGGGQCLRRSKGVPCDGCEHGASVLDHVALWRRPGSRRRPTVLTSQPYGGDIARAHRLAEMFGLSVLVSRDLSWHMPGVTTLLVFDADGVIS